MEQTHNDPQGEREKFIMAFNDTMIRIWQEQITLLDVIDTRHLLNSVKALPVRADGRFFEVGLSQLFTDETEVIRFGVLFLRLVAPLFPISCVSRTYAAASRGMGRSKGPMYLMLLSYVVIRQIYLFVVTRFVANTPRLVGFGYPVGWMSVCVIEVAYFFIRWKGKTVEE